MFLGTMFIYFYSRDNPNKRSQSSGVYKMCGGGPIEPMSADQQETDKVNIYH